MKQEVAQFLIIVLGGITIYTVWKYFNNLKTNKKDKEIWKE